MTATPQRQEVTPDGERTAARGVTIHLLKSPEDIEALLPLGAECHGELYRGDEPFEPEKARAFGRKVLENPGTHAVLFKGAVSARRGGDITGDCGRTECTIQDLSPIFLHGSH